ncbi:MAG: hypothetical protein ACXW20_12330 [Burkholderiales bacterium]
MNLASATDRRLISACPVGCNAKLGAEILTTPARLLDRGHDMIAFLGKR